MSDHEEDGVDIGAVGSSLSAADQAAETQDIADFAVLLASRKRKKSKQAGGHADESDVVFDSAASGAQAGAGRPKDGSASDLGSYDQMVDRFFSIMWEKNPQMRQKKRHHMPPPQVARVGSKKVMWSNFPQMCEIMKRSTDHVHAFFAAELGTEGSIDGQKRLIIRGRYTPKQIESLLKKYIIGYVSCQMCRSPVTDLVRDSATRLYFLNCTACKSKRSVAPIKSGFHATARGERRRERMAAA